MFKLLGPPGFCGPKILHRPSAMVNPLLQRGYNGLKLLDLSTRRQQGPGANGVEKARIGGLGPVGSGALDHAAEIAAGENMNVEMGNFLMRVGAVVGEEPVAPLDGAEFTRHSAEQKIGGVPRSEGVGDRPGRFLHPEILPLLGEYKAESGRGRAFRLG